jgi:hypothetical protein
MKIKEVLELDPKKEYEIWYSGHNIWKQAYYQESGYYLEKEINPNDLPVLDNEYRSDTGELLYNDKGEAVFDPTQEIQYEFQLEREYEKIYKSKTFIRLFQEKIKELELETDDEGNCDDNEIMEKLMIKHGIGFLEELFDSVGCNDQVCIEDDDGRISPNDWLLWYSSTLLDDEYGELVIGGITIFTNY